MDKENTYDDIYFEGMRQLNERNITGEDWLDQFVGKTLQVVEETPFQEFTIYGDDMPGFNEILSAAKTRGRKQSQNGYSWLKKKWINIIVNVLKKEKIYHIDKIHLVMIWLERNKKRDPDNIIAFTKFVLDGLQKANIIENDGWKQVKSIENTFKVTGKRGVIVRLYDATK